MFEKIFYKQLIKMKDFDMAPTRRKIEEDPNLLKFLLKFLKY